MLLGGATYAQNRGRAAPAVRLRGISDPQARSRMLFTEAAKVIMNPRCMKTANPASDRPTQRQRHAPRIRPRSRAEFDGGGVPGNTCGPATWTATSRFSPVSSIVRKPAGTFALGSGADEMRGRASRSARSAGRSKDPRATADVISRCWHEHLAHDDLGRLGLETGARSRPRTGTQQQLGELVQPGSTAARVSLTRLSP